MVAAHERAGACSAVRAGETLRAEASAVLAETVGVARPSLGGPGVGVAGRAGLLVAEVPRPSLLAHALVGGVALPVAEALVEAHLGGAVCTAPSVDALA